MDIRTKLGFYSWNYYRYLFIYVLLKETGSLLRLIGMNFIVALLPIIIISFKSLQLTGDERLHFFVDAAVVIFCTTVLITTLFKIVVNENEDLKPFKATMFIVIMIVYVLGLLAYLDFRSEINKTWEDFFKLVWISTGFLILTFIVVFYVHFTELIDFKSDVEPFIEKRKQDRMVKKAKKANKSKSGDSV